MWGRKSKKESQGQTCPLCQLVNTEDAESCTRCYYEFTVAAHRQVVSEISDEESGGLFDALLEDDEDVGEESPLVDWTSHSFSMDDMTVEVSPYDEDGMVEVDQTVSMEHQFDAPQQVAKIKKQPEEEEDYVLTAADAPKDVKKFDTGDGPDLTFEEEEYSAPVVKLVEMTESEDVEPVQSASTIIDEDDSIIDSESPTENETSSTPVEPVSDPVAPVTPAVPGVPEIPAVPAVPEAPVVPEVPKVPAVPEIPSTQTVPETVAPPTIAEPVSARKPIPTGIWPWPQSEAWDDSTVRKTLRDAMESAKSGDIATSKRTLVSLGPHLGDRVDLVFHIGVLLKKFEQEEVMRRMIESARNQYPDNPEVAKAVQHLLS
ncbi:MAG: hypothetical protein VX473_00020 [Candidatus Thermoplasmatota archaeon]|nr:hypothetical protein [Candidatus Thermoplasmatota archaeon]